MWFLYSFLSMNKGFPLVKTTIIPTKHFPNSNDFVSANLNLIFLIFLSFSFTSGKILFSISIDFLYLLFCLISGKWMIFPPLNLNSIKYGIKPKKYLNDSIFLPSIYLPSKKFNLEMLSSTSLSLQGIMIVSDIWNFGGSGGGITELLGLLSSSGVFLSSYVKVYLLISAKSL